MKIALAMIVKGSDAEAKVLERCLENVSPHVDGIFITATHKKGEEPNKKVVKVATKYKANISHYEWINDFADARNYNFAQVPPEYHYILWCDADDVFRGLEKLKDTIEANPQVDAFAMWYLYDFDEHKKPTAVHKKTMLVRNDKSLTWVGALHEDFEANREVETFLIKGIDRIHLSTNERFEVAAKRNVEVSEADVLRNPDDPRVYWNVANSYLSVGDNYKAKGALEDFIDLSQSDEEKFLAHIRLAQVYENIGDLDSALRNFYISIGLRPQYPNGFLETGYYFMRQNMPDKAIEYIYMGLPLPVPDKTIIVYNPRDYDYNPLMALAKLWFMKQRPDLALPVLKQVLKIYPDHEKIKVQVETMEGEMERMNGVMELLKSLQGVTDKDEIKKKLDTVPADLRSHPAVCAFRNSVFIRTDSSGRDLVYYCGYTTHEWNPDIYEKKGFGGSEEAVYYLTKEFVRQGWNVTVYNNCGTEGMERYGVTWRPFWEFNPKDKSDVLILWRHPKLTDYELNAGKVYLDLHDVLKEGELHSKRLEKITKIFVKSNAHRVLFPSIPDEKFVVVPNGIDTSLFERPVKKDPYLLVNTSSADRSLDVLPKLFKRVKKEVPKARLKWAYGWGVFDNTHTGKTEREWKARVIKEMDDAGIEVLGKLNPEEVTDLYLKASILAYPTEFYEIDCISVRKAQLAGCLPITTDFAALETTNAWGVKVHSPKDKDSWGTKFSHGLEDPEAQDMWVEAVVKYLKSPPEDAVIDGMKTWAKGFDWKEISNVWNKNLK